MLLFTRVNDTFPTVESICNELNKRGEASYELHDLVPKYGVLILSVINLIKEVSILCILSRVQFSLVEVSAIY